MPGGALAVSRADEIVSLVNELAALPIYDLIVDTQDWHPADHLSFAINHSGKKPYDLIEVSGLEQVLWPSHCVQSSYGAEFQKDLNRSRVDLVIQKGIDKNIDSYSAFYDNAHLRSTGLGDYLRAQGVTDVDIAGVALDYCVLYSAIDAQREGFKTRVIENACRAITLNRNDYDLVLNDFRKNGIELILSGECL